MRLRNVDTEEEVFHRVKASIVSALFGHARHGRYYLSLCTLHVSCVLNFALQACSLRETLTNYPFKPHDVTSLIISPVYTSTLWRFSTTAWSLLQVPAFGMYDRSGPHPRSCTKYLAVFEWHEWAPNGKLKLTGILACLKILSSPASLVCIWYLGTTIEDRLLRRS